MAAEQSASTNVEDLRPDTSGLSLTLKVLDTRMVVDRRPGKNTLAPVRIAEALVGDETGVVVMTARNEQLDVVAKGKYIQVTHGHVDMHKGSMRLVVNDKGGKVEPAEADFEPKASFNMSLVEFELVSVAAVQAEKPREANGTALARTTADGNAE
eukprot:jgi/Astpho2/5686/Aster-02925